ncbi:hypothetical protein TNCV_4508921 [Trichonephila clavipes]|nr:hypothetical protein TNCV_4508921 [Trichonephila clavipes]
MILQHWTKKRENPRTEQVGQQRERANQENRRRGHCIQLKETVSGYTGFVEKKPGQSCSRAMTSNRAGSSSFAASDKNENAAPLHKIKKKIYY